jgi:hypothetical protein
MNINNENRESMHNPLKLPEGRKRVFKEEMWQHERSKEPYLSSRAILRFN